MFAQYLSSKSLQHLFPGDVSNEMLSLLLVNHIYYGSLLTELIGNASANSVCTTSYYDYFIFKHKYILLYHQHNSSFALKKVSG